MAKNQTASIKQTTHTHTHTHTYIYIYSLVVRYALWAADAEAAEYGPDKLASRDLLVMRIGLLACPCSRVVI